ncbi:bifunctional 2-C-methyl-D-erythritol 4-phosphate cytidylyltransferase/2-C-methyl-D-erythritol 2,4-cyclodiphosphate synthase [Aliihoeflea aestuarii]|uniref:bifunctional 2-C-methyl-D-erythritol 4-phosphate cytidylyltransferase/2-C-methyl-D-erythritol 2,4-cyclodiphosphate synthase n=1 Tax=Aliihoeflea aestuarii TaxID=453840 RepID=UPI002093FF23|nr:bifunctional 2-C-methyl-D-erythritol 4-phosphate cytidylyltransferase/2-C-methyl-D-erythritol 2,4-cyclodiphosphate synthase [Aliihoeflea aestuarii]MCO6390661.1 bifunctional 2-C-methyl-D-erythritol 4-phosphate cytidylyltransferase/2-C-methyl-D-erythritol 2,4-cyclodiphosphate synthase [Aliihoeflea aestuarii]
MKKMKIAAIIVAAGRGERAGDPADGPKQYRHIGGEAVLRHTLRTFLHHPDIDVVAIAIHPDDEQLFREAAGEFADRVLVVVGGATRQASTWNALQELAAHAPDAVLVHDGVRPFADAALIARVVTGIDARTGSLPALAVSDTLKEASPEGLVARTVPRAGLFGAQTPQGFPFALLHLAHARAAGEGRDDFTDDASIAEWAGIPVRLVEGSPDNIKLTWARDIASADEKMRKTVAMFPDIRTGNGYDVHSFEPGDAVILCGVAIPYDRKLSGHSDADVGLHALTDALLATCGAGDIGTHFPPSDLQWKGAASHIFVEEAVRIVRAKKGRIANADITLICESPRIGPYRDAMTKKLVAMLGISADRVSVKATTNEKLGFVGRGEGIAAIATATVAYPGGLPE